MTIKHVLLGACLYVSLSCAQATPVIIDQAFTEVGNNVEVTFAIRDIARNAFDALPIKFHINLVEVDPVFDDLLGSFAFNLTDLMATVLALNGYESLSITHTFINAADAFTGLGNDYQLQIGVPEPAALLLFGAGLLGLVMTRTRPFPRRAAA